MAPRTAIFLTPRYHLRMTSTIIEGDDKNYGIAGGADGEYVFITERPWLNDGGLYQAAGIDAHDSRYIIYWAADDDYPAGFDPDAYLVELL
jgi:hypothetical protein